MMEGEITNNGDRRDGDVTWGDECEGRPTTATLPNYYFVFPQNPSP